jgi:hypothetical protein
LPLYGLLTTRITSQNLLKPKRAPHEFSVERHVVDICSPTLFPVVRPQHPTDTNNTHIYIAELM